MLEIQWHEGGEWQPWRSESPKINISDPMSELRLYGGYTPPPWHIRPFQDATSITVDGYNVYDYRINGGESYRERQSSCNCCA